MSNSREVSQFSNFIVVDDSNRNIGIATTATPYVGIGTTNPQYKLDVVGDLNFTGTLRQNGSEYSSGINSVSEDTTPQLGGNLDLNGKTIDGTGGINITGVVTATSFTGNLTGTATTATNVTVTTSTTNSAFKVPFANTTANTTGNYGLLQDSASTFTYNPSTDTLTVGTFSGSGASLTSLNASNISSGTINDAYLPATISSDITGNAATATTATNANNINISANSPSDTTTYPVFVANSSTGNQTPFIDTGISWNASSNILTVPTIQVSTGIDLDDSDYIYFGTSDDVKVFYDETANDLEIELESTANKIAITDDGTYKHLITRDGKVGINTSVTPTVELEVNGDANIAGVVTATAFYGDGSNLTGVSGGAADGTDFNTGITTTVYFNPGIARTDYPFTGIGISFPATAGKKYIVESIHVTNVVGNDMYVTSEVDYNGGEIVPLTNRIIVPYQGAVDLLEESIITNPEDKLRFLAYTGIGTTAPTRANALDCFITYTEKDNTDYIGTGATITQTIGNVGYAQTVFTSTTYPSVINTIVLTNYSNFVDVDASVFMRRGGTIQQGYFVYNLTIPQNSSVQILPKAKRLNATDTIVVNASAPNVLSVNLAGKYIT